MSSFAFDSGGAVSSATQAAETIIVGDAGAPAFDSGWIDSGDVDSDLVSFVIVNSVVYLMGVAAGGIAGTNIFTLPSGYRPPKKRVFPCVSNGAFGVVSILATGEVEVTVGNILGVNLSGVSFVSV